MTNEAKPVEIIDWKGAAGQSWVEAAVLTDRMFKPIEDLLVSAAELQSATALLDIGCGSGATTVAAAKAMAPGAKATGIDISPALVEAAMARAHREDVDASFICDDAATHAFPGKRFDRFTSRFGVMFFDDSVSAFANLRKAAKPGALMRLVVWRSANENPFATTAERAAAPLLPGLPDRDNDAPGQFAFAKPARVRSILSESGWTDIVIDPVDVACAFPLSEIDTFMTRIGPVARALADADATTRDKVLDAIRPAFDALIEGGEVRFNAACWMVSART